MKRFHPTLIALTVCVLPLAAHAQPTTQPISKDYSNSTVVTRMMAFDKKHDGKLTKDEITDDRLLPLFDQADTNSDGVVTKQELMTLAAKLDIQTDRRNGPGGPGGRRGGPGAMGGPGRGFGGPPQPGQILPSFMQDSLDLTDDQKKQLDALQSEVNQKLANILTKDQNDRLSQMGRRGPDDGGPDNGPGGPPR
jgi:hypothetical protein